MGRYFESRERSRGRTGTLHLMRNGTSLPDQATPYLYPVINFMTGTTPNGGGIWRYICEDLLAQNDPGVAAMSQVLHFLDFHLSPDALQKWRAQTLRERYRSDRRDSLDYQAPLFLDSGGFKLLFKPELTLAPYGLLEPGREAESILELQRDLGGDIVASLDYPLPPNLDPVEARERMAKSHENALQSLKILCTHDGFRGFTPFLYVACHGLTADAIEQHVRGIFQAARERGLPTDFIGIAIGSLVPLRSAGRYAEMVDIIRGAIRGVPDELRPSIPIHVFGISGDLVPLLTYLGVDTFDSSTYVQSSRSLDYYHPDKRKMVHLLELEELPCDCRICSKVDFGQLHETFTAREEYHPKETGIYKSSFYAKVALHNWEMEVGLLRRTQQALEAESLADLLVEHATHFPRLHDAMRALAKDDSVLAPRITKVIYDSHLTQQSTRNPQQLPLPPFRRKTKEQKAPTVVSMRLTPDDFRVPRSYVPPTGKDLLLLVPCSETKPYAESRSHRTLAKRLKLILGDPIVGRIHKISVSGLYGPVPEEFEMEENILRYNFLLSPLDKAQVALGSQRLRTYLEGHGTHYHAIFGYATSKAYRMVLQRVAEEYKALRVFPSKLASQLPTEFYRNSHLDELAEAIAVAAGVASAEDDSNLERGVIPGCSPELREG